MIGAPRPVPRGPECRPGRRGWSSGPGRGVRLHRRAPRPIVEALVAARETLPSLRALFLGDITSEENEISWIKQSDVTPLLDAYPAPGALPGPGRGRAWSFGSLRHEHLRSLVVESGGLAGEVVRAVAASDLPAAGAPGTLAGDRGLRRRRHRRGPGPDPPGRPIPGPPLPRPAQQRESPTRSPRPWPRPRSCAGSRCSTSRSATSATRGPWPSRRAPTSPAGEARHPPSLRLRRGDRRSLKALGIELDAGDRAGSRTDMGRRGATVTSPSRSEGMPDRDAAPRRGRRQPRRPARRPVPGGLAAPGCRRRRSSPTSTCSPAGHLEAGRPQGQPSCGSSRRAGTSRSSGAPGAAGADVDGRGRARPGSAARRRWGWRSTAGGSGTRGSGTSGFRRLRRIDGQRAACPPHVAMNRAGGRSR